MFQPALVLQCDLVPLIFVLSTISTGITLPSGGLEGYLLGVGMVRPWMRLPLAAADLSLSAAK
ncbi:MAG: hypothetical protein OTI35_11530 [Sulfitobacter sp.]|nr:hypothetical protein [Sulfitobacter sp.]